MRQSGGWNESIVRYSAVACPQVRQAPVFGGANLALHTEESMSEETLCFTAATELARMIRAKRVSPVEVMDATLSRAQALNPRLNAICTPTYDAAAETARAAEAAVMRGDALGPLHGVPTT